MLMNGTNGNEPVSYTHLYDRLQAAGNVVDKANYELVYSAPLAPETSLEDIYTRFNICLLYTSAIPLYRLLSETGTGEEAHRAGTLKGGFFHGT